VVDVNGWQVGDTRSVIESGYSIGYTSPAILDTGTTLMYVPTEFYRPILNRIMRKTDAKRSIGGYYVDNCLNLG